MKFNKIFAGLFSLGLMLSPICVYADENNIVAQSEDGTQTYTDYSSAWNAAKSGQNIVLMSDWYTSEHLVVGTSETVTIEMNGHMISRNLGESTKKDGEVIYVEENATLNLNGNNASKTLFAYVGYDESNQYASRRLTSGGLITGGASSNGAGGIHMKKQSTVNLNHVGVAGNIASTFYNCAGGGINIDGSDCFLDMKDSYVVYNKARYGGGIHVDGSNVIINMDHSTISNNYAVENGGGVNSNWDATYVCMNNDSRIIKNYAGDDGGGIYFCNPYCQVTSGDGLAEMYDNVCRRNGGAVYFNSSLRNNYALVKKISFKTNSAGEHGGVIYLDENNATIEDCKFNNNSAEDGGAIYLNSKNTYITNCTFEDNHVTNQGGAIADFHSDNSIDNCTFLRNSAEFEGGGIYVSQQYDITLSGKVVIKDNKRGGDYADDLMLQKAVFKTAYVKGEVEAGSSIGIRTGTLKETQVGKDIPSDCSEYFFLNDDGNYHISYENGTLQKRSGSLVGSIFGDNNLGAAVLVMTGICIVGIVILFVHNKRNCEEA
jgi:predicted outer membrane repeat protein